MRLSRIVWLPVAALVLWTVMRVAGLERGFPLVALISYTPQVAVAGAVLLALVLVLRLRAAALVCGVCVAALALAVVPRALPNDAPDGGVELRVMTANVALGHGSAEAVVEHVRRERVDLLSVQEVTPEFEAALEQAGLRELLPHAVVEAASDARGTALYGRMRLIAGEPLTGVHTQVVAEAAAIGRVVAVHPPPPTANRYALWDDDLRALPDAQLLVGDFNATLDHVELRRILARGYDDAAASSGAGLRKTWPSHRSWPLGVAIDHVLYRSPWRARSVEILDIPRSDHRAVVAVLVRPSR